MQIKNSEYVEQLLNCQLPDDYKIFLNTKGIGIIDGFEIFGYTEQMKHIEELPCIIGATKKYREIGVLSSMEIPIADADGNIICFNLEEKNYFIKKIDGTLTRIESIFK